MALQRISALALIAVIIALGFAPTFAGSSQEDDASAYTQSSLAAIERWEKLLYETKQEPVQVAVYAESMLEYLTWLYEVDKLSAAMPHIKKLLGKVDVTTRFGFSHDGKTCATISVMELKEPVFSSYSMFLISIENRSAFALDSSQCKLTFALKGGETLVPEIIEQGHPLFSHLERLANTFYPPDAVAPGATASFKAVMPAPGIDQRQLSYVLLEMGEHSVMIKFYDNLD